MYRDTYILTLTMTHCARNGAAHNSQGHILAKDMAKVDCQSADVIGSGFGSDQREGWRPKLGWFYTSTLWAHGTYFGPLL